MVVCGRVHRKRILVHLVLMPTKKIIKTSGKTAKTVVKKASTKGKRELTQAPCEQCFWVTDGRVLSNLTDLRDALASMTDDVFMYHVTKERNDFANWIEYVLQDAELASSFRKSKKPNTARDVVVSRLRIYII